ncbi:MAG: hypothetical protein AB8B55_07615, partial [Mariniblastus sp.]
SEPPYAPLVETFFPRQAAMTQRIYLGNLSNDRCASAPLRLCVIQEITTTQISLSSEPPYSSLVETFIQRKVAKPLRRKGSI